MLKGYHDLISLIAFSHDLTQLTLASRDNTIKIWNVSIGECLQMLVGYYEFYSVAFSHNSAQLASTSRNSIVKIWDASSNECLQTLMDYCDLVSLIAFS